jgi:hypothetical protein
MKIWVVFFFDSLIPHSLNFSCENTACTAGNCVLYYFNSEFTKKINKITYKTDKNANIFVILLVLFVILHINIVCEFTSKIIEHTVASYESSDFT